MRARYAAAAAVLLLAAACGGTSGTGSGSSTATVLAAASLTDAFRAVGTAFHRAHPDENVRFSFAGSQSLVAQVKEGAPADVLATADERTMATVRDRLTGPPQTFARNVLVIAVAPGNPKGVHGLADLARPGLTVVLAAPAVPAGAYARQALEAAGVTVHPASLEENVRAVLTKVELGEADAGVVYASDATAAGRQVASVPVQDSPTATYPVGVLTGNRAGRDFVAYLRSAGGQQILTRYGFRPA